MADKVTKQWTRNASDELAIAKGCRFDEERGVFVVEWMQDHLVLYEGDFAGQPMEITDWVYECTMRMFGWVRSSKRWKREVRRFRRASIWVPKKNKKSPTLAGWGLYLLMGDGEMGQKVFLAAKDGGQARDIAGRHAIEMCQASDALMADCTINKNLMRIMHEPTRSIMQPISSGHERNQKSKEGLNGSVLVDETHVVDRKFMSRISRAGISRSEPLQIEVSTAGSDPDSYGKSQWDRGRLIEEGQLEDLTTFFCGYSAPQELGDDELAFDPIKWGKMANPAWDHTVGEEEYLSDYANSVSSVTDLADFKMYRLNIWQASSNPWLKAEDWHNCRREFDLEDFRGQPCWLGLDMSKTRDMTALIVVFRGDGEDEFWQFPFFWLPEATAKNHAREVPFLDWAKSGDLQLIEGEVIHSAPLKTVLAEIHESCLVQQIWADRTFAEDLTLWTEETYGTERVHFPQTAAAYAGPIEDYERLVIQGTLHHPGNRVLTWQAGHCTLKTDQKGRKTLVKPGDIKKIDGMDAGVMALHGAIAEHVVDVYEDGGLYG